MNPARWLLAVALAASAHAAQEVRIHIDPGRNVRPKLVWEPAFGEDEAGNKG